MEGEGILCQVTAVIGEGKQRRYEIRDSDPDLGQAATPYRASLQQMTPIPATAAKLPDLPPKKNVLALYPQTTTFYKAEVVLFKPRQPGEVQKPGMVWLRFEGEDEADMQTEVERRYVLSDWTGK
jgi:SAGA-associated factor 29